jgi:hypothetical protein
LHMYQALANLWAADVGLFGTMLEGLSCSQYKACPEAVPDMFGLSARGGSSGPLPRLREFSERRLEKNGVIVLVAVGKGFA